MDEAYFQELPRLSKDSNSKLFETRSKRAILLLKIPNLNLYVITDCNNFGSNWIEVNFCNKVYTTRYLMGENEDLFSVIARRFAQDIIEANLEPTAKTQSLDKDDKIQDLSTRTIMINIALRNTEISEIQDISSHLRKF